MSLVIHVLHLVSATDPGLHNQNSSDDDIFWAVILTNSAPQTSATSFVSSLAYIVSHELNEAFTDRDGKGFTTQEGCEMGDICESRDPNCASCCTTFTYTVASINTL